MLPFLAFSQIKPALPAGRGVSPILNSHNGSSENTYAVVVGISDYQDPAIPDLRFADKDAEAFANYLRSPAGGSLDKDHLRLLTNSNATAGKVASALYWLVDESKEADQVIIYFSGHGDVERKFVGQPGFLLCWDSPYNVYMAGGTIELGMLQSIVSTLSLENRANVLIVTDACHAGKLAGSNINGSQVTNTNLARQYANEIKILSCQPNEFSLEGVQWGGGRGVFSYHLLNALYGLANQNKDNTISLKEISRHLEDYVSREAAPESQNPIVVGDKETVISKIFPDFIKTQLKNSNGTISEFSSVENRGLEVQVLETVDSSTQKMYRLFKSALNEKQFFEPLNACAEYYYEKLKANPKLEPLWNSMLRSYAANLQDNAQNLLNAILKGERKIKYFGHGGLILKISPTVKELERAAILLGENHYMYKSMMSRKYFVEAHILILEYFMFGNLKKEIILEKLNLSLQFQENSPLALSLKSYVYYIAKIHHDSCINFCIQALEQAPNYYLPYYILGKLSSDDSIQFANIVRIVKKTTSINLNSYPIDKLATERQISMWLNEKDNALETENYLLNLIDLDSTYLRSYANLTMFYLKTKQYKKGENMFMKDTSNFDLLDDLSEFLGVLKYYEKGIWCAQKMIALDSTNFLGWNNLGWTYLYQKNYKASETALNQAIALEPFCKVCLNGLGQLYLSIGNFIDAQIMYKRVVSTDPKNIRWWGLLGDAYFGNKDFGNAESAYLKQIEFDSLSIPSWYNLHKLYISQQKYDLAESIVDTIYSIDSNQVNYWINIGNLNLVIGNPAKSEQSFKKAIQLDSSSAQSYLSLANIYYDIHHYPEAEIYYKKSINLGYENALRYLGDLYLETNRTEEAKLSYEELLKKSTKAPNSLLGMTIVYSRKGDIPKAFEYLQKSLEAGFTNIKRLEEDTDFSPLRDLPEWNALMKKYFPNMMKN